MKKGKGKADRALSDFSVSYGGNSDRGEKKHNQDAFAALLPSNQAECRHKGMVACIADGVSCSENSQVASQISVTHFIEDYLATPKTLTVRESAGIVLNRLNQWLFHHGQQDNLKHNTMVASFSALIVKSNTAYIFHAGDCRIYLFRNNELSVLTRDHRQYTLNEQHYLIRGLGMDAHLEVDYQSIDIQPGDMLLLTTDGIHETLSQTALKDILLGQYDIRKESMLAANKGHDAGLECLAKQITDAAKQTGGDDNGTCLLVSIHSLPPLLLGESIEFLSTRSIPPVLEVGQKIDGYLIKRVIYSGSRSHLYLVKDLEDNKEYVLKTPSENFEDDPSYLQAFIREGWIGEHMSHAGIMRVFESRESTPFLYHVCEHIKGVTLRQWLYDNPKPDIADVRMIAAEVIVAIRALQRGGIYHGDIKPDNIMIRPDMTVVLIDFGSAHVKGYQELNDPVTHLLPAGDLNYLAPECLISPEPNMSSELFSLGVTLYETLTGELPYKRVRSQRMGRTVAKMDYIPISRFRSDVPEWIDVALKKACHPLPEGRFNALSEFITALHKPVTTDVTSMPLIERDPVLFWQCISGVLLALLLVQWLW
ncbi:bifunctional protein-serine/threonine kinase/phosphatase [Veronia pacifica]|uniref:bifunctional protein-serine/threonine kinase/phosphatase n=1 Tax=Veronia pacifica TaxID=1080227 RepID=UPI001586F444|nr:bifunctional protein-serine/threonine kinase/phosphatase [Veronia pacifica]